jgi:hypothetical protein
MQAVVDATLLPSCTQPVGDTQLSAVQTLLSSQLIVPLPTQLPLAHASVMVQASPSSQVAPSAADA